MARERTEMESFPTGPGGVWRVNWGCGEWAQPGWIKRFEI